MLLQKSTIIGVLLLAVGSIAGTANNAESSDSSQQHATPKEELKVQKTCPVMGGKINKELFVDQDGQRIYVCCQGCIEGLKTNFNKYVAKLEMSGQKPELITNLDTLSDAKVKVEKVK